jgi:pyruvate dehydrogenase E1 component alpha subunit
MANTRRSTKKGVAAAANDAMFAGSMPVSASLTPFQILAPDGTPVREDLIPDLDLVEEMYRQMSRLRHLDDKFMLLYKSQKLGNYAQFGGQEASQIGTAMVLDRKLDFIAPMYRSTAAMITHGWGIKNAIMYWRGHPEGWRLPDSANLLPIIISIPGQIVHATGAAMALQMQKTGGIAMTYIGEGGTSQGDFHIGVNFAAARKAPAVFVIENNGWAISVPRKVQSGVDYLMRRAEGYGIPGYLVDGNDILAVHAVAKKAAQDARDGKGPSLIEQMTYRIRPHTTGDDPKAYRDENGDPKFWAEHRDPIQRLRQFLTNEKRWNEDREVAMMVEISTEFQEALDAADAFAAPDPKALLEYVFVDPPSQIKEQQAILAERIKEASA